MSIRLQRRRRAYDRAARREQNSTYVFLRTTKGKTPKITAVEPYWKRLRIDHALDTRYSDFNSLNVKW